MTTESQLRDQLANQRQREALARGAGQDLIADKYARLAARTAADLDAITGGPEASDRMTTAGLLAAGVSR